MKLTDILSLKSMKFMDKPREKDIKKINTIPNLLKDFPIKTSWETHHHVLSSKTRIELEQLSQLPHDVDFVHKMDRIDKVYKEYLTVGLEFPEALVEQLIDDASIFTRTLKVHYNRPRPYQVPDHPLVNIKIGEEAKMESMNTPSYPNGHSTQGILIGRVLSDMFPKHKFNLMNIGLDISKSRNIGRAHYASDSRFGMKLGHEMFDYLKKMNRI